MTTPPRISKVNGTSIPNLPTGPPRWTSPTAILAWRTSLFLCNSLQLYSARLKSYKRCRFADEPVTSKINHRLLIGEDSRYPPPLPSRYRSPSPAESVVRTVWYVNRSRQSFSNFVFPSLSSCCANSTTTDHKNLELVASLLVAIVPYELVDLEYNLIFLGLFFEWILSLQTSPRLNFFHKAALNAQGHPRDSFWCLLVMIMTFPS